MIFENVGGLVVVVGSFFSMIVVLELALQVVICYMDSNEVSGVGMSSVGLI